MTPIVMIHLHMATILSHLKRCRFHTLTRYSRFNCTQVEQHHLA